MALAGKSVLGDDDDNRASESAVVGGVFSAVVGGFFSAVAVDLGVFSEVAVGFFSLEAATVRGILNKQEERGAK